MSLISSISLWWKSLTPIEKVNAVFKGITSTTAVIGAGCCIYETRSSRKMIDHAVNQIGESVEVEISQDLIDEAVAKAAEYQIAKTVKTAVDRDWRNIQAEATKQVHEAVDKSRSEIQKGVADALAEECKKLHQTDILNDIRDKAKDALAEKLDDRLDDITDEYSKNLNNMGKVYEALAEKLSKS